MTAPRAPVVVVCMGDHIPSQETIDALDAACKKYLEEHINFRPGDPVRLGEWQQMASRIDAAARALTSSIEYARNRAQNELLDQIFLHQGRL